MRIIAGKHKGRRIELDRDATTVRPTSEFAREAIFNILSHSKHVEEDDSFIGKAVLDVFCGSGAFGLEALSRGAASVTFIDKAREAIGTARHNAGKMGELETSEFLAGDATRLPRARKSFSLVFIDPPYFGNLIAPTLTSLLNGGWLAPGALLVIEHDSKETVALPPEFIKLDERRYGRALVSLLRFQSAA